jgi:FG-GAP repeat
MPLPSRALIRSAALLGLAAAAGAQNRPIELEWLRNAGARFTGAAEDQRVGHSVAGVGDVNGDGLGDFLIGATEGSGDILNDPPGRAFLFYGAPGLTLGGVAADSADVTFVGEDNGWQTGFCVAGAGDVNGDGFDDLLIGASRAKTNSNTASGRVYLVWGGAALPATVNLIALLPTEGVVINGAQTGDLLGTSLAGLGDVDLDGVPDMLLGASGEGQDDGSNARGSAYILYGDPALPALLEIEAPVGATVSRFIGTANNDDVGESASVAGDVNADGFMDALVGSERAPSGTGTNGAAYILYGGAALPASTDLASLGALGTVINGQISGDLLGHDVAGGSDVDGDGYADVLLGARNAAAPGTQSGRAYLLHGDASLPLAIAAASIGSTQSGVVFNGIDANDSAGAAVATGGDVDGDGLPDLLIGASGGDPGGGTNGEGEVYLVDGGSWPGSGALSLGALNEHGVVLNGVDAGDAAGSSSPHGHALAIVGDVDGDGFADVLVGAPSADPAGGSSGAAWLVKGTCHMSQAVGPVAEGGTLNLRAHGAPGAASLTFAALSALPVPLDTKFGPWWLIAQVDLFLAAIGANGELFLPLGMPPVGSGLVGVTVNLQTLGTPQGSQLDLTYLLALTVE